MNTTEHIVELYYRICHKNFTYTDFKVKGGNNRQFDVLAYNKKKNKLRHIEVGVTHSTCWTSELEKVKEEIGYKFFGKPKNKRPNNPKTDFNRGKTYRHQIENAYKEFGFTWEQVIRVWCLWFHTKDKKEISKWKKDLALEYELKPKNFEILSFRDVVFPYLTEFVGTSNYDDEILRTISLIDQRRKQIKK